MAADPQFGQHKFHPSLSDVKDPNAHHLSASEIAQGQT